MAIAIFFWVITLLISFAMKDDKSIITRFDDMHINESAEKIRIRIMTKRRELYNTASMTNSFR
jgi:hypothetical protein